MARKEPIEIRMERNRLAKEAAAATAQKNKRNKVITIVCCVLAVALIIGGIVLYNYINRPRKYEAQITVKNYGTITLTLDGNYAPKTVENFVELAESGFYDGLTFHRIIKGFMIQGGDPEHNGKGGSGKNIVGEFAENGIENNLSHKRGVISMARSQKPNSASSQFFICDADSSASLDGKYAAFGWVTDGMDVVDKIAADAKPTDDNGTIPYEKQPVIESITVKEIIEE